MRTGKHAGATTTARLVPLSDRARTVNGMTREEAAKLLGVPVDAGHAKCKSAYRKRVRTHHPDVGGDPETFDSYTHAYEVMLGKPRKERPAACEEPAAGTATSEDSDWFSDSTQTPVDDDMPLGDYAREARTTATKERETTSKPPEAKSPVTRGQRVAWALTIAVLAGTAAVADGGRTAVGLYRLLLPGIRPSAYLLDTRGPGYTAMLVAVWLVAVLGCCGIGFACASAVRATVVGVAAAGVLSLAWLGVWFGWWPGIVPAGTIIAGTVAFSWARQQFRARFGG